MGKLSAIKIRLLTGLLTGGHAYIGASEYQDASELYADGLTKHWSTVGGFFAHRITKEGRAALSRALAEQQKG